MVDNSRGGCGIYCFRHSASGKSYLGQSCQLWIRKSTHLQQLRLGVHPNKHFQNAFAKYGESAFIYGVVEYCQPESLTEREQHWFDSFGPSKLYNKAPIAGSCRGLKASAEARAKMSAFRKGKKVSPESRARMATAQQLRFALIKQNAPPKIVAPRQSKTISASHIEALVKGRLRSGMSEECKRKIALAHLGKRLTNEHRAKLRAARARAKPISEQTRARMSAARMAYYAGRSI